MSARHFAIGAALTFAVATSASAQQQLMPSLAEVARQAEAAKPAQPKAKKSYTNADLHVAAADIEAAAAATAGDVAATGGKAVSGNAGSGEAAVQGAADTADPTHGHAMPEEHWRQRADFIRAQVSKMKAEIARLNVAAPGRSAILEARNANEIRKNQQGLDSLAKQWAMLEESARVARVPADWIGTTPFDPQ